MTIDYDHTLNRHTLNGAAAALSSMFLSKLPNSVLDVGCGTGTWMRAAIDLGVKTVRGIDGIMVPDDTLLVEKSLVHQRDLTKAFHLGAKFDLALCLEVGRTSSGDCRCGTDRLDCSACRYCAVQRRMPQSTRSAPRELPVADLFNSHGFVCEDSVRWSIRTDSQGRKTHQSSHSTAG
jgi:hypothetical protein